MHVFLAFLIILGISHRLLATSIRRTPLHRLRTPFQTITSPSLYTRLNTYTTKYITAPMFFRYKNTSTWGWIRLPNRLQGILVGVYVGLNVVFVFVGYETFEDNLYWRNDQRVSSLSRLHKMALISRRSEPKLIVPEFGRGTGSAVSICSGPHRYARVSPLLQHITTCLIRSLIN
jgi:hypothetical protein